MKKSTFSSIKTRLKEQGYYNRYYVPNFPKIGLEIHFSRFGKMNRYTTYEERMRLAEELLLSFKEDIYVVSESNNTFTLSVSENLTQYELNNEKFYKLYIINNFLSRKGLTTVSFPFELSQFHSFSDFETIVAKLFGFDSESYDNRMTIPDGVVKKQKLTKAEKKVLVGLVQYPEESDTLIADKIGVSRNTVANAKRKFLKKEIIFPRVVPSLERLGLEILNYTYFRFHPKVTKQTRTEIADQVRQIISPHFYITKSLDGYMVSAHPSVEQFEEASSEINQYFMRNEYLLEEPTNLQLELKEMARIKEFDYLPIVKKILGFDESIPIIDQ